MASVRIPNFHSVDLSKLDLSKLDLSKLDLPKLDLSKVDTGAVTNAAKDAAYVTIGLAVLAFQKAQQRRNDLTKNLAAFDRRVEALEGRLDVAVEDLEKRLPERAGALLNQAHDKARAARRQVRDLIVTPA